MNADLFDFVLVNTTHPGNIGGVARAIKNMGFSRLTLVEPKGFPAPEARWRAASADDVLDSARIVATVPDALADAQFVVGTSARERRIPWPVQDARRCAQRMFERACAGERVAMLFGREDRGLVNEELELCNLHCHIPTHEAYPSLNLAMAVQILAYELRMSFLGEEVAVPEDDQWDAPFATSDNMSRFYVHLEQTLVDIGFLDPKAPKQLMRRLKRLFNRVRLDEMELNILRGILSESQRHKIPENPPVGPKTD